jgi:hypothetical protein
VAEEVKAFLTKFQKRYHNINNRKVEKILENGAKRIKKLAATKIKEVKDKIGV